MVVPLACLGRDGRSPECRHRSEGPACPLGCLARWDSDWPTAASRSRCCASFPAGRTGLMTPASGRRERRCNLRAEGSDLRRPVTVARLVVPPRLVLSVAPDGPWAVGRRSQQARLNSPQGPIGKGGPHQKTPCHLSWSRLPRMLPLPLPWVKPALWQPRRSPDASGVPRVDSPPVPRLLRQRADRRGIRWSPLSLQRWDRRQARAFSLRAGPGRRAGGPAAGAGRSPPAAVRRPPR